jgi:opacity protein-like surface antigen
MALGSVNVGGGHTWQDQCDTSGGGECGATQDIDDQFMNIHGGATVYAPYDANWGVQFGLAADAAYANEEDDNNYGTGVSLFSQIAFYDKQNQFSTFAAFGRTSSIDENTASFFAAGFGAQWFCDQWTFGAQLGYLDAFDDQNGGSDDDFFHEAGFLRALAAFYAGERLKLSANVAYADGVQDSSDDAVLWEWGAGVEYLFSSKMPASVYLEYRGVDVEETFSGGGTGADEFQNHRVDIGIRVLFNAPDVKTADRTGGTNNLPAFHRWVSEAGEQID